MDNKDAGDRSIPKLTAKLRELADEIELKAMETCGECMGAAFGDCDICPKGKIEQ